MNVTEFTINPDELSTAQLNVNFRQMVNMNKRNIKLFESFPNDDTER